MRSSDGPEGRKRLLSQRRLCTLATSQLRAREDLPHRRNKRSKRIGPVAAKHLFRLFLEAASNLHPRRRMPCIFGQTSQGPGPCASYPRPPEFIAQPNFPAAASMIRPAT